MPSTDSMALDYTLAQAEQFTTEEDTKFYLIELSVAFPTGYIHLPPKRNT